MSVNLTFSEYWRPWERLWTRPFQMAFNIQTIGFESSPKCYENAPNTCFPFVKLSLLTHAFSAYLFTFIYLQIQAVNSFDSSPLHVSNCSDHGFVLTSLPATASQSRVPTITTNDTNATFDPWFRRWFKLVITDNLYIHDIRFYTKL